MIKNMKKNTDPLLKKLVIEGMPLHDWDNGGGVMHEWDGSAAR